MLNITDVLEITKSCFSKDDEALVRHAYQFANAAHREQIRKSGEPYIQHPLHTAQTLAKMKLDATTIAAALLHDTLEDTKITKKELHKEFGNEITFLVESVTKLGSVRIRRNITIPDQDKNIPDAFHSMERQVQILRKMFIAMAKDIRVILIKLADRLHNMETLKYVDPAKQLRLARETLDVYAPIAHRLGIGELKGRLEDLAFPFVYPDEHHTLQDNIGSILVARTKYIAKVQKIIHMEMNKMGIKGEIHGRAKHLYSLYKKLKHYNNNIDQIYDLVALRITVRTISECYAVLGMIHTLWKPLSGRIKDYIAVPKPNGYQSLHTTVFCLDGQITEIQIRTYQMHQQAEYGIAAHWHYKNNPGNNNIPFPKLPSYQELNWVSELASWQKKMTDPREITQGLKLDFFQDRLFVFTPKGDVHDLPVGATPIDFAFAVHSDVGYHCAGAKINGKMVTLNHALQSGDMIEIITNKKSSPKIDWLNFTKTSSARSSIRHALKVKQ